ncbi:MAG: molybdenum cofactor guanylyltransferase, partial [Candidatus Margulisbacteria bacterium]|nr:molybdenum cofactor guanylyltransferase [Candidatus Margulisiibacteriota bacterium]
MLNAIVLAGGRSSRFGTDKAFVKVGGSTIIESLLFPLSLIFEKIIVVTNHAEKFQKFPVELVEDRIKGLGPLAGLHSGLLASDQQRNFVVACDMPLLNPRLIQYICSVPYGQIVVPRIKDKVEPLHAVYSKACIPIIEEQIASGDYKIQNSFGKADVCYVEEEAIRKFDPSLTSFLNINLQKDLKKIVSCL